MKLEQIIKTKIPYFEIDHFGTKSCFINGKLHRTDGPAIERADGSKYWYIHGKLHREGGPAIEYADGHKEWWLDGRYHREGGAAVEYTNGHKEWFLNGKRHREDGPAVERSDGYKEWHLHGQKFSEEKWLKYKIYKIPLSNQDLVDVVLDFVKENGLESFPKKVVNQLFLRIPKDQTRIIGYLDKIVK